jgi:RND family efflux transporter MFP subunit
VAVARGQPLASLDQREAGDAVRAARAALLQAQVAEARAARELERAEGLRGAGLLTRQGLEDAHTARAAAAAATELAAAQLDAAEIRVAKAVIRAPFDGVVAARGVNVGDRVEHMGGGDPLFEVVDDRVLDLTMAVPSQRLDAVRVGQAVQFQVDAAPGRVFTGKVTYVNPSVDPGSRAGRVVAEVANRDGRLRGGLFAKARIVTGERRGILRVPRAALQAWDTDAGTAEVFVVAGATARRRAVRTGADAGDLVEVSGGLGAGERVATRGAYNLREGDRVAVTAPPGE